MPYKKYTEKQKAAYWKKQALAKKRQTARKRHHPHGHGGYDLPKNFFSAKKLGGYLGGAGGALIGNMIAPGVGGEVGSELGSQGGQYLGRLFKKITGWGDYNVKQNSLLFEDAVVPSFGEDSIRVRKREFIASLNSVASVFTNHTFDINPGLDTSFPWLCAVANNYEQYRINGMIFQFVSTSSDAIASTTALGLGQVILATNYDAAADDFQDATQMLNYMFSNSGKPSENILHAIECAPTDTAQKLYYVRSGDVPSGQDPRLFDLGKFQIAVNNMPATYGGMGQLWVSYDITFCKSVQNNVLGLSLNTDMWILTSGLTNAFPFGDGGTTNYAPVSGSNLGCELNVSNIYFPEGIYSGYYQIYLWWSGTATALTINAFTPTNCSAVQCWGGTASKLSTPGTGVSSAVLAQTCVVKLGTTDNVTQPILGVSAGVLPTSMTRCVVLINQVNGEIYNDFVLTSGAF